MGSEKITVSKEYYDVLLDYIFGCKKPNIIDVACSGAYSDMASHTMKWEKVDGETEKARNENKFAWRKSVAKTIIEPGVGELIKGGANFDSIHKEICTQITKGLADKTLLTYPRTLSYGQAQKWLNMTLKNALVAGCEESEKLEEIKGFLHCPVDGYIIQAAKDIGVKPTSDEPWSKWNEEDVYDKFQKDLNDKLGGVSRFDWEIAIWSIYKSNLSRKEKINEAEKLLEQLMREKGNQ